MSFNDAEDNVTLHRMRRPFGKAAFSLREDGTLELRGHPIPRYPACAEVTLDASFEPVRIDGPARRALCMLEMNLSDRSAFFTWVTLRLRRNPALLNWLYDLTAARQIASLGRLLDVSTAAAATEVAQPPSPPYVLTTALLRELARSVRESGAEFWLVAERSEWQLLDVQALERDGIEPLFSELPGSPEEIHYLQFRNDAHMNETGHARIAKWLADRLAPVIRAARSKGAVKPESAAPAN
jgi:hypothetical protein